ncbi:hypothetical protein GT037_002289 [Alternaria burnsii]|uniref:Uncharacterized protein n=1 Tax=Alternaria burnsii TaxID=1187904 RepID=A0A8H7BFU6_9PLEO|nr:uncharacterized protein GT037_002289 [Alternaria burnsii]KAF7680638.1 hypothetical protein GT037_002289 [Alternaria burnsii]
MSSLTTTSFHVQRPSVMRFRDALHRWGNWSNPGLPDDLDRWRQRPSSPTPLDQSAPSANFH